MKNVTLCRESNTLSHLICQQSSTPPDSLPVFYWISLQYFHLKYYLKLRYCNTNLKQKETQILFELNVAYQEGIEMKRRLKTCTREGRRKTLKVQRRYEFFVSAQRVTLDTSIISTRLQPLKMFTNVGLLRMNICAEYVFI